MRVRAILKIDEIGIDTYLHYTHDRCLKWQRAYNKISGKRCIIILDTQGFIYKPSLASNKQTHKNNISIYHLIHPT